MNNNNDKLKKRKRVILITTISMVMFSTISLLIGRNPTRIEMMLRDSVSLIEYYVIKKPVSFVGDIFNQYYTLRDVYEENAILREKLDNYEIIESQNRALSGDFDKLKELTDIDYFKTDYKVKYAYVQSRPIDGWNQEVVINVGSIGGVEVGMAVMTSQGMIGLVTATSELSATVSLLTHERMVNSVPVQIHNGDELVYGLLDHYDVTTGRYEITLLDNIGALENDALVMTSGLGASNEAQGLLIGTAIDIGTKEDGITTKVFVEPSAQFNDLRYVAVVLSESDINE